MRLGSKTSWRLALGVAMLPAGAAFGQTLPSNGFFAAGSGDFSPGPASLTINQTSARGVIDWTGFSIGAGNIVTFNNGGGATLNRVTGAGLSSIAGKLGATGTVFLINPNGVVVRAGGKVITGGSFVASTRDLANSQFMAGGAEQMSGGGAGTVENLGEIVSTNGDVVLIGAAAANAGVILAPHGTAALAAGNRILLSDGDGPKGIYVAPDAAASGSVTNTGVIKAAAAALAAAGGNVFALAGNRGGLIAATGTENIAGQVWLTAPGGTVAVSGTVKAAGPDAGGTILARGGAITLAGTAVLDAAGRPGQPGGTMETSGTKMVLGDATVTAGAGGNWLVDPDTLTIGSAAAGAIDTALNAGTNVTEQTTASGVDDGSGAAAIAGGAGDIDVAAPLAWSSGATLTLAAYNDVNIEAPVSIAGNGGLAISTGGALHFFAAGAVAYTGGADSNVAPLTINGAAYTLVFSAAQLQGVSGSGDYALARTLNETGVSGFVPIGESTPFTGDFNGLGNAISNLNINDTADPFVGLFGQIGSGGVVENLGVTGSITGGAYAYVGGLAGGVEGGTVRNVYASASAAGGSANGGLVGFANGATIEESYASGAVGDGAYSGGLVAFGVGGTEQESYATGAVSGGADAVVGGLIGYDGGVTVRDTYATGAATGGVDAAVGGLAGLAAGGKITDSYATGAVTGGNDTGGLAGAGAGALYTDDYFDTTTTGVTAGPGTGLSTAQWLSEGPTVAGSPYGFADASAWVPGAPYPVLAALPYLIVAQSGAQVYGGTASHEITGITDPAGNDAAGLVDLSGFSTLTDVTSASAVGAYALGGSGAKAAGYEIDFTGNITVTPAPLTITLGNQSAVYGTSPALNENDFTATGTLYNGDTLTGVMLGASATAASPVGSGYTVFATGETGTGLGNYDISVNDGIFSVTPAALTITANAQSSIYGQTPGLGTTAFGTAGLVTANGDSVTAVSLTTAENSASPVGGYTITPGGAVGTGLGNYVITYETGPLTISPAVLTITADDATKNAGSEIDLGTAAFTAAGLVNGDSVSAVTLTSDGTAAGASVQNSPYAIVPIGAAGSGLSNYTIAYVDGALTVEATVSFNAVAQAAAYLPDGNAIAAATQVPQAGPNANTPAALPLIISQADAAAVVATAGGLAVSTGLPLANRGNETALLADRGRHLQVSLPPAAAISAGAGF